MARAERHNPHSIATVRIRIAESCLGSFLAAGLLLNTSVA
jgi:hypothetical protein